MGTEKPAGKFIEWTVQYSVGNQTIDDQHKQLFAITNRMFEGLKGGETKATLFKTFEDLIEYTRYHFTTEEKYMGSSGFPDIEEHKAEHRKLLAELLQLRDKFEKSAEIVEIDLLEFLLHWISNHILGHDLRYVPFIKKGQNAE
ncbi:MAG: hemerythrin [Candidatus Omnitrophica bacterium CG11_big_fil_rev_8_21_14_0_20_45_26]|uniref:Hemerythrin n=1 Tax=Candidatus Abzuiibacterium crystallinum TaxID=1974748 RepID=A0A2H0LS71_9BACT|nr:MAG: hemerythrin [Candidatus Omnitrophica bacterium CG11_big_fil_rev_8_21_14_0_20_45_26]PIW64261.1 MAG: hemerythrin [Candidatus Omnitrophica bacterium CG12_big_fil_rev_8_21_14_0_65_45_16]